MCKDIDSFTIPLLRHMVIKSLQKLEATCIFKLEKFKHVQNFRAAPSYIFYTEINSL